MDIAALSMVMAQTKLKQQVDISVMRQAIDLKEMETNEIVKLMESSTHPHLGKQLDIRK